MDQGQKPENYVVRGMNQKYNYFVNKNFIIDLEHNMPMQSVSNVSLMGKGGSKTYPNQRKIFEDDSRYLNLDNPNLITFPQSRMDMLFWKNIVEKGENIETIEENTTLAQFNEVYDGYSLFHYFAENVNVIEMIHNRFLLASQDGLLTEEDKNMPLIMLHPDVNNRTALDLAIYLERPKSFELMINMLEPFNDTCLSKMLLTCFPHMVNLGTDMICKFFNSAIYQPVMMQKALIVKWPSEMTEQVFTAHTSFITENILNETLKDLVEDDKEDDNNGEGLNAMFAEMKEIQKLKDKRK